LASDGAIKSNVVIIQPSLEFTEVFCILSSEGEKSNDVSKSGSARSKLGKRQSVGQRGLKGSQPTQLYHEFRLGRERPSVDAWERTSGVAFSRSFFLKHSTYSFLSSRLAAKYSHVHLCLRSLTSSNIALPANCRSARDRLDSRASGGGRYFRYW
jgi:hypothetical protein